MLENSLSFSKRSSKMRDNSSMEVNKGKRKGMDQIDESAEKKKKIEIKEELCDRCEEKRFVERILVIMKGIFRSIGVWKGKKWCLTCAHEHVFALKSTADSTKVAEAAARKWEIKTVEEERAAKKKVEEAKDDLKLKQEANKEAEAELNTFLGTIGLEKHYSGI